MSTRTITIQTLPSTPTWLTMALVDGCGTVRINCHGLPPDIKVMLTKGEMVSSPADDGMLALKWMDKRPAHMLTTIHDDSLITKQRCTRLVPGGREDIRKPHAIEEYNRYMGGVEKSDQLMSYYGFGHRTPSVLPPARHGSSKLHFVQRVYTIDEEAYPREVPDPSGPRATFRCWGGTTTASRQTSFSTFPNQFTPHRKALPREDSSWSRRQALAA